MRLVNAHLIALLLIAGNVFITCANIIRKDLTQATDNERNKRAIDFGLFVRNLLLKSATASNAKANFSNNILNSKTTTPAPRRRTTTTTRAPIFFTKGPFIFPFDFSGAINNKFRNGGYINFDYNDYGNQQPVRPGRRRRPTTTTTTTTTTTPAPTAPPPPPPPPRRRPVPRRPYGLVNKQYLPQFDYYDDYDYDNADNTPSSTAPPNPPTVAPRKRPAANRAKAQGRVPPLRNRLVYQFRQPDDTSTNNNAVQPAADEDSQTTNNNSNNTDNDETSANANDNTDDTSEDESDGNANDDDLNNIPDDSNPNIRQENNSSDNSNPNINPNNSNDNDNDDGNLSSGPGPAPPFLPNSNFNLNPFQGRFDYSGNLNGSPPPRFNNFNPSAGPQYSPYNGFNFDYQPSPSAGYSIRYY